MGSVNKLFILGLYLCLTLILGVMSSCPSGFTNLSNGTCTDVDVCREDKYCPNNAFCFNTIGSVFCQCEPGFRSSSGKINLTFTETCEEINECRENKTICGPNATCSNTIGSYNCTCNKGYKSSTGEDKFNTNLDVTCEDINECRENTMICGPNATCSNTIGSYNCTCIKGYKTSSGEDKFNTNQKFTCDDINECRENTMICGPNATCSNTIGSYNCTCIKGYKTSSGEDKFNTNQKFTCDDIDECKMIPPVCGPQTNCNNTPGSYSCIPFCGPGLINYGNGSSQCKKLNCNSLFKNEAGQEKLPSGLKKVVNDLNDSCLMISDQSYPDGNTYLMRFLGIVDDLLLGGVLDRKSVSSFLHTTEQAMMLIAPLMKESQTWINVSTLGVDFLVSRGSDPPTGSISLSSEYAVLDTHWETVASQDNQGFAAAALVTYYDLESSVNSSFDAVFRETGEKDRTSFQINSKVVTVSVSNEHTEKLEKSVHITFSNLKKAEYKTCVYWNKGEWSTQGCVAKHFNDTHTVCECDHLSSFAVLMSLYDLKDSFELQMITWVGLSLSLLCLLLCIVTFYWCRSIQGTRNTIHLHLCISLFIADLVFLAGISRTQNKGGCALVAGLLHFFFLASFCWMCLEGIQLYRMVVLVFHTTLHRLHMLAFGYGIPLVIVVISAISYPGGYGTDRHCWLALDRGLIWSFFGPVCVIIMINAFFFMITVWKLALKFSSLNPDLSNLKKIKKFTITAVAQLCILGSMWIFGCFQFEENTIVMSYLFTILNSIQGVLIFVMHCLLSKPVRDEYRKFLPPVCRTEKKPKYSEFSSSTNNSANSQSLKNSRNTGESQM
ncbi:adhesion G protein-coupled receptor E5 isoform X2 [Lepisosteus oculatus]|uniref:adhesion G protein-coupled receptor E5 isoform X2 n=1 Tax=Lepisosteus oculatus TaxID=7918 RepID=UPI0035F523C5